jgi:hypothetical protein
MGINKEAILSRLGRTSYPPRRMRATSQSSRLDLADKLGKGTPNRRSREVVPLHRGRSATRGLPEATLLLARGRRLS